mmetsp:Transcript_17708/g.40855  ORF Transcript_17708/g.40855 Transcript_17708/m.40855 type:complete len:284 (+) Transcript_17708:164-1015(+)|eukprot:CAMPEP_0197176184 /NCGR_PEP_ID=MMETSP1423-20130617/2196_1 /TAXON_ID=476441 /ORGANISM="Pseudo-nitzschia heimii, Strain UNC1101" /LENGTH=283 /DNA_ID=CAMNT_0042625517 /DNA_START=132 /DNA_END=986 /DNA_ORIENTATION=-
MSEQEEGNPTSEIPCSSSKVSGIGKKKKAHHNAELDEVVTDVDDGNMHMHTKKSKKKKKKKNTKSQSVRSETGSAIDNEINMPTKADDDTYNENDDKYADHFSEQSNNYSNVARKKDRNKMRTPDEMMGRTGNMYPHNHYEGEEPLPYSSSTIDGSTVSSKRYNDRGRNNGQPKPMYMESHDENGFTEYEDGDYNSGIGTMDPGDGYNQDYDMSEDDEEEPRFKYSTADLDDGDCRNTRCCLIAAGAFFVFIAILVSIFMAKMVNKDDRRRFLNSIRNLRGSI